jgi:tetratricopeptide (TPR) repeat protein
LALAALDRHDEALRIWSQALDDDPDDPRLWLGRAWSLIRLRRHDRALADLDQAAERCPGRGPLPWQVGSAYAACLAGRPDRAVPWLAMRGRSILRAIVERRGGRQG